MARCPIPVHTIPIYFNFKVFTIAAASTPIPGALRPPPPAEIETARRRLEGLALRTPLLRLAADGPAEIYLKLENLQPVGAFKIRCLGNLLLELGGPDGLPGPLYTASSGNSGYALAWLGRRFGAAVTVYVPPTAPPSKLASIAALGAQIERVDAQRWWQIIAAAGLPQADGCFIDPVGEPAALAGNATIGLEILEDLPDVDTIVAPAGGGALACGIAAAVKAAKPDTRVLAAECALSRPFQAAFSAGRAVAVPMTPSFVSGIGAPRVLPAIWPLAARLLDGAVAAGTAEIAAAIRLLYRRHGIIAEGAGATALATALAGRAGAGKLVCIVSGGNIGAEMLQVILSGGVPAAPAVEADPSAAGPG